MSEEKKATDQADDPELNELLDSALKDFDKPLSSSIKTKDDSEKTKESTSEASKDSVAAEELWTEDFISQAADQFQKNFETFMQNGGDSDIGATFKKMAQSVADGITENGEGSSDFQTAISQALKDLSASTENVQNNFNISEADLASMFGQTSLDDSSGDIFPFMQGMMQSLLSKEVLYPSLKELVDKYPAWLEEKKDKIEPSDLERYKKQLDLMKQVCSELETEKENDAEDIKKKRFELVLNLMQQMQSCGQPPEDLVDGQNSLFQVDADGNPILPPALPGLDEPPNCCVM